MGNFEHVWCLRLDMIPKTAQFAETLLLLAKGAAPTLIVLALLAVLGVPPYGGILTDLLSLM